MPGPIFTGDEIDNNVPLTGSTNDAHSNYWQNYFLQQGGNLPPLPQYDTAASDAARVQHMQVIQDLQRQAAGDWNSRAQQSLGANNKAAQGQQYSLASSQRGVNAGAQLNQAQQGAGQIGSQLAGQSQQLYLAEQQAAQQQLAQQLAAMQAADNAQASNMAGATLQGQALNDAASQYYLGQGMSDALAGYNLNQGWRDARLGFNVDSNNLRNNYINSGIGAAGTTFGTLASMANSGSGQQPSNVRNPAIDDAFNGYDPDPYGGIGR